MNFRGVLHGVVTAGVICVALSGKLLADGSDAGRLQWPEWRGPDSNGVARTDAPLHWSNTQNIKWKTDIPGRGHSTPVVWEDRVFVTTAIPTKPAPNPPPDGGVGQRRRGGFGGGDGSPQPEHRFEVLCLDRRTGAILWQRTATTASPHEGAHATYGSFASNSPVTDGKRVWASFGSQGIYCYDLKGALVWKRDLGVQLRMRLQFGEGTAPVLDEDRLILLFDYEGDSFIVALDKNTGKELWRTARDERSNWSTPLIVDHKGTKQVVVSASNKVRSYDFKTGKLVWECSGLGANTIPAPVHSDGVVYVMSGFRSPKLMAIRLGKGGDLTGSDAILWSQTRGLSYTPSPVLYENRLYVLTDTGLLSCFNAITGEPAFQQARLPKPYNFKASPVAAGGKLYLASEDGDVVVVKLSDSFEVLATNTLDDEFFIASPVVVGGEILLRGRNRLYCISEKR